MKKYVLFILVFIINIQVYALSSTVQNNISMYAKEMVEKANQRIAKDNTPLPQYGSGDKRLPAFNNELYEGHFVFNCDSFVSYVLYHTYGFPVVNKKNEPHMVINYESAAKKGEWIYMVTDISYEYSYDEIKDSLQKSDVILCYKNGEVVHTFLYIGDDLIAQSRRAGLMIDSFATYASDTSYKYKVARLKEEGITKDVDMSIYWPDTKEVEVLGEVNEVNDEYPSLNLYYDNAANKRTITIVMEDDILIDSYCINCDSDETSWIKVNKQNYAFNYVVTENGIYEVKVRDTKGQVTNKIVEVTNINERNYRSRGSDTYNVSDNIKISHYTYTFIMILIVLSIGIIVILIKERKRYKKIRSVKKSKKITKSN